MNFVFLAYLIVFGGAASICLFGVFRTKNFSDRDVRQGIAALLLTSAVWAGSYMGVLLTSASRAAYGFHLLGLVAGAAAVGAWLWFCSAYAGRTLHRDPSVQRWALSLFTFVVLTKLSNPWHGLHFTTQPEAVPFSHLAIEYHVLYWGSAGLAYALAAIGYFILYDLFRNVGSGGGALGPLAALMALPIVFNAVGYAHPSLLNVSHEPIGVAAFAAGIFFLYGQEFHAVQFAGTGTDPTFVLDEDGRLREYNESARSLLPEGLDPEEVLGTPLRRILPGIGDNVSAREPIIEFGDAPNVRYYQVETRTPEVDIGEPIRVLRLADVTEQKMREDILKEERDALHRLSRMAIDPEAPIKQKMSRFLELGREYLDLSYGFLTEISEGTQTFVYASGAHPLIQTGSTYPLSETYCRTTIQQENLLAIDNVEQAGWDRDPAYETFELGSYIGAKLVVDGTLYGTFCFADSDPRGVAFDDREKAFVELLTRWASYELRQLRDKERLKSQNERLEDFTSVVSHDLRNPLNVAQGRIALALEQVEDSLKVEVPDESLPGHLRATDRALKRMDRLIEDMLALTWSEQGLGREDLDKVSLKEVAVQCWQQVEAPEATLHVENECKLEAHEGRLRQLLENLFRNAVEHGRDDVTIRVGTVSDGFYVEDDGPGIPKEKRDEVFERGHSSREEGTGLGLSIADAIGEAHGWDLSVTEGRAGGARFEIRGTAENRRDDPTEGRSASS